nr:hypothetical protein [Neorhizobium tomejilense]
MLADEMGFHHSSFLLSAELLFPSDEPPEGEELPFILPQRAVTTWDAAMLLCLAAAMDQGFMEPSEVSEYARDVVGAGENLAAVVEGIEMGKSIKLRLAGQFGAEITVPASLIEKITPFVKGGAISHLRSV